MNDFSSAALGQNALYGELLVGDNWMSSAPLFERIVEHAAKRLREFDPGYGPYLLEHSREVGDELDALLQYLDWDNRYLALFLRDDAFLHDLGKTHESQKGIWQITEHKVDRTDAERAKRAEHTVLGPVVLDEILLEQGIDQERLPEQDKRRIARIKHMQIHHHDKFDRNPDMDPIMQALCCVDALSGKKKALNFPNAHPMEITGITFSRLATDDKHRGQLNTGMLRAYGESLLQRGKMHQKAIDTAYSLVSP